MKTNLLTIILALFIVLGANSQNLTKTLLFQEDFEGGIPLSWANFEEASNGHLWESSTMNPVSGTNSVRANVSYELSNDERWLVTPEISLANSNNELTFYMSQENFAEESFSSLYVSVSTTSQTNTNSFTEVDGWWDDSYLVTETPNLFTIDLSAYNNQAVYIAFHVSNINNYGPVTDSWIIDDVTINGTIPANADATLSDLTVSGTTVPGFNSGTLVYNVELPAGTTVVPVVAGTPTNASATAVTTDASSLPGSSTVLVTAADGTTIQTYTVNFNLAPASVNTITNNIKIYPNPSNGIFTIELNEVLNTNIEISDISGKLIKQFTVNNKKTSIDLTNYAKGVYFIKTMNNEIIKIEKIIIK